jgi:hypothetical protein
MPLRTNLLLRVLVTYEEGKKSLFVWNGTWLTIGRGDGTFLIFFILFRIYNETGNVRGYVQNIPDCCRRLYSSFGSAKHR